MDELTYFEQFIGDEKPLPLHFPKGEVYREFAVGVLYSEGDGRTFRVAGASSMDDAAQFLERTFKREFLRRFVTVIDSRDITRPSDKGRWNWFEFDVRL